MIQYPGGVIVNATFVGATRQDIVDGIHTNLLAAGWTDVSGPASDRLMQSALTPQGLQCRMRIHDPGAVNCALVRALSVDGLRDSGDLGFLLPAAAKTFRIIANKYQFFVTVPGSENPRDFVCGGTLFLEDFLIGVITEAIWIQSNAANDTDTTGRNSFRSDLDTVSGGAGWQTCNTNAWSSASSGGGQQRLLNAAVVQKWHDGSGFKIPARIFWGLTDRNDEAKIRGQLFGAVVSTNQNAMDLTTTFDGHDWFNVTSDFLSGSLWLQIT
jgi:hypothetical protein